MLKKFLTVTTAVAALSLAGAAHAGRVFLTGHDPDFHAQDEVSGQHILSAALNYVTNGSYNGGVQRFLWVESDLAPTSGHRVGELGLTTIGLTEGVNYDEATAAQLGTVNFANYSAIVVASDFGGMLTDAEITGLVARRADIATFVNNGGGLAAFAECGVGFSNCNPDLVNASTPLFGFVPIGVSSVDTITPYTATAFGNSIGIFTADVNDCCTHNSFAAPAGLNIVDTDGHGVATTLAGDVQIGGGGFTPGIPEPATWTLMIGGFGMAGAMLRRRRAMVAA